MYTSTSVACEVATYSNETAKGPKLLWNTVLW